MSRICLVCRKPLAEAEGVFGFNDDDMCLPCYSSCDQQHRVNSKDPFAPFARWLDWLDSHDGRLHRRSRGQEETDMDIACLVPTPPGQTIITIGDLRALVESGRELAELRSRMDRASREVLETASVSGDLISLELRGLEGTPIPTRVERIVDGQHGGYRALDVDDCSFTDADVVRASPADAGYDKPEAGPCPPVIRPGPKLAVMDCVRLDCDLTRYHPDLTAGAAGVVLALVGQAMCRGDDRFTFVKFDKAGCWDIITDNLSKMR
jgi:hypothetical protein